MLYSFSTVYIFPSPQMKSRGRDEDEGEHEEGEDDGDSANEDDSWTQHNTHTHIQVYTKQVCVCESFCPVVMCSFLLKWRKFFDVLWILITTDPQQSRVLFSGFSGFILNLVKL